MSKEVRTLFAGRTAGPSGSSGECSSQSSVPNAAGNPSYFYLSILFKICNLVIVYLTSFIFFIYPFCCNHLPSSVYLTSCLQII